MKLLIEVPDGKAGFVLQLLHALPGIKVRELTSHQAGVLAGLAEAVGEMKKVKTGKLKARNAEELIDEL
ncbi:MAG: hypothetical protein MUC38_14365 [Cyclobacteriaceae bacterium]|jgi:hypothetical protein|nr:hypothetical protein [Cyclobacteriaceae bacterium]